MPKSFAARSATGVFADRRRAFKAVLLALETFEESPADFYPYSSKYDAFLRGTAALSAAEQRGLAAFNDPARGNCARCHPSRGARGRISPVHGLRLRRTRRAA